MSTIKSSTEHLTLNADGSGKDIKFQANGVEKASISSAGAFTSTSIDATKLSGALPAIDGSALTGGGKVLQVVHSKTGALATGTTVIPWDDTIPQNTEGDEYMTLAITPSNTANKLKIEVVSNIAQSAIGSWIQTALFQDTTAGALASTASYTPDGGDMENFSFVHYMTAGTTSATTFKVRAGGNSAGTTSFNGANGVARLGGVIPSSITITEIKA